MLVMSQEDAGAVAGRWKRSLAAVLTGALCLSWPAIYNGFPLLYPDSMTYLDSGRKVAGAVFLHRHLTYYGMRSFFYSVAILPFHWNVNPWPVVALQTLLVALVLWLVICSVAGLRARAWFVALMILLSGLTSVSWYSCLILPDVLGPVLYLAVYLLVFARDQLSRAQRWGLAGVVFWGMTAHATHWMLTILLLICLAGWQLLWKGPSRPALRGLAEVSGILGIAVMSQLALHGYLYGKPSLNGERPPFLTARVIADGPGRRFLEEHCAGRNWVVCRYRERMPSDPDAFLWGADGPVQTLPRQELEQMLREEVPFVLATIEAYPREQFVRSASNFWGQLNTFGYDDLDPSSWVLDGFPAVMPAAQAAYERGKQAHDALPRDQFDEIQKWTVWTSLLMIVLLVALLRRRMPPRMVGLAWVIAVTVVGNAALTGTLSMVEDRLQARVEWLVPLYAGLLGMVWVAERRRTSGAGASSI